MRPTIIPGKKNPAARPDPSLKFTSAETLMNLTNLNNDIGTTTKHVQAILAPLASTIDQWCTAQHLDHVRCEPEEFDCTHSEFLRYAIKLCGGQDLALCDVRDTDGHHFQVAGPSYGLTKALRDKRSDGVDTGLPVVWICPVTGRAFPISSLGHLLDVVASYAHRSARKAASV
ncbi:hypothetical protein [Pseudomonas sp. GV085]|uniref:hypothetical protein n=1 Tax=Pseudomonas sp. GV085 TaxID=2135756 RepID=UPI000D39AB88|nr:hypothetical protein [Pseudomonas sp. GV085]PTR29614.1 hypothetical protein C8K63_101507 [Pseudomonas sp. GV085]